MRHLLSKSTYIKGLQCKKYLYLNRYYPALKDPLTDKQQAVFNRGHQVGDLARDLFPGGKDAFPGSYRQTPEWIARTAQLMGEGCQVIYEAAFQSEQVMVAVDILVKDGKGWIAYEIKSSARISQIYMEDSALQYHIITGAGISLHDFYLVHINTSYILGDKLDVHSLFTKVSVKGEIEQQAELIAQRIKEFKEVLEKKSTPEVEIGEQCFSPYTCDFRGHCWKHLPATGTIFDLSGKNKSTLFEWYRTGKILMSDLTASEMESRDVQIQVESFLKNRIHQEKEPLQEFLNSLKYPLLFLDFETFMPAIPVYKGTHPYQQIPFQYSLHRIDKPGDDQEHFDFVAEPGSDPRPAFTKALVKVLEGAGTILAYNAPFERSIMAQCKISVPEHSDKLESAISKVADLMEPFKKKWYYHPAMSGSASIKNVLPALAPGFSYDGLTINNGAAAMGAYESLANVNDLFTVSETIEALKEYCKLDTLAMVKLWEVLVSTVK